jgi:hypothetical protein
MIRIILRIVFYGSSLGSKYELFISTPVVASNWKPSLYKINPYHFRDMDFDFYDAS